MGPRIKLIHFLSAPFQSVARINQNKRKNDKRADGDEEGRDHFGRESSTAFANDGGVGPAPFLDAIVDDEEDRDAEERQGGSKELFGLTGFTKRAEAQIREVDHPRREGGGEARIPSPIDAPCLPRP